MQKNITIYDIARELNISPCTVSRVLNNSAHPVKAEIRTRVLEATRRMGYVPNAQARNLKMQTSRSIGVLLPSISNPFYPSIMRGMEDEATSSGYMITFASCDKEPSHIDRHTQQMLEQNMCGIITLFLEYLPEHLSRYVMTGGCLVSLVEKDTTFPFAHNLTNDKQAEADAVALHLLDLGHRKIAYLSDEIDCHLREQRLRGICRTLEAAGLRPGEDYAVYINGRDIPLQSASSVDCGAELTQLLLARRQDITGVICMNDMMALGAMKVFREAHLSVPQDYSLVSFDDLFFAECIQPPLTTMRIEKYLWGQSMVRYLIDNLQQPSGEKQSVLSVESFMPASTLAVRGSTGAPRSS